MIFSSPGGGNFPRSTRLKNVALMLAISAAWFKPKPFFSRSLRTNGPNCLPVLLNPACLIGIPRAEAKEFLKI